MEKLKEVKVNRNVAERTDAQKLTVWSKEPMAKSHDQKQMAKSQEHWELKPKANGQWQRAKSKKQMANGKEPKAKR